jgi:PAS domain S-box-containing protein
MDCKNKSKKQLISEIKGLRKYVKKLESALTKHKKNTGSGHLHAKLTKREKEYRQLNMLLDSIIENIPNMIFLKDAEELRFQKFNRAGEQLLGYKREDMLGKNDYDFFPKDQADFFISKDRQVLSRGKVVDIPEEPINTHGKGTRILHTQKVPIYNEKGKSKYLLGISEDITDYKKFENELKLFKKNMELVLDVTKTGIDIIDSDYNLIYIDTRWANIYGDYRGRKCYEYFMGRKNVCPGCGARTAFKTKKPVIKEERLIKEGNRPISVTSMPFTDERGKWLVAEVNVDISEMKKTHVTIEKLKKTQHALKESEAKYRALFESANDGIFLADTSTGVIIDANKKAAKMLGRTLRDVIRMHYTDIHPRNDREFYRSLFNEHMLRDKSFRRVACVADSRGRHIPVQISASKIYIKGRILLMGVFSDITELKNIENSLRGDKNNLEIVIARERKKLETAMMELESSKRLADLGALAAMIAHELRNPLGVIKTAIYNIKQKAEASCTNNIVSHIVNIDKKILESDRIINNLLTYSKVAAPTYEKVNIHKTIYDCVKVFRQKYKTGKAKLVVDCGETKNFIIKADRVQLESLLINILDNAYQALPDGAGTIRLSCRRYKQGKHVLIAVKDSGIGLSKADISKAFEPFFSLKIKGIGLGLSVCRQIVKLHKGSLKIMSKRSKGTTVKISLPVSGK